jgi:[acyl-carrier-protein] S-malonyltransferase
VKASCEEASQGEVCSAANINSPSQVVIAGAAGAIDRAIVILKERGAKRAMKLNVSAPFHCAMMKPAQDRLAADLDTIQFSDSEMPLVTNVDARASPALIYCATVWCDRFRSRSAGLSQLNF